MSEFVTLEDTYFSVNLEMLASSSYSMIEFKPLTDFLITDLIYHGDTCSLFHGKFRGEPCIIETCTRIPFRHVCREIKLLAELKQIPQIVHVKECTKNPSLGIVSIAYENFSILRRNMPINPENILPLFKQLLNTLSLIHNANIAHLWICRSTVHISEDQKSLTIGQFHCASRINEQSPFAVKHRCAPPESYQQDPRKDDIYAAAKWFISFYSASSDVDINQLSVSDNVKKALILMTDLTPENRPTAKDVLQLLA